MEAYLDNAATTKLCKEAFEVMQKTMLEDFGNPSSLHLKGVKASEYVKNARKIIARELKCQEKEIIFTSGGTESNNMALIGTALANKRSGKHIVSTRYEHASLYNPLLFLEQQGFEVTFVEVERDGRVSPERLAEAVRNDTILVSVMYVNNEIGSLNDISALSDAVKNVNPNVIFHCDAIQAFPKFKIIPKKQGIDMMSVSSHKFGGPKGCGFLYVRDRVKLSPIIFGGGQQNGMRSGTENVGGITGMAAALEAYSLNRTDYVDRMYELKTRFVKEMLKIDGVVVNAIPCRKETTTEHNGDSENKTEQNHCFENEICKSGINQNSDLEAGIRETAPHIISVSFPKAKSEVFLHVLEMKGIYCSSGSACSSNHPAISGTLKAIGVADEYLDTTLRFSLSPETTQEEIDYAAAVIREQLPTYMRFFKK